MIVQAPIEMRIVGSDCQLVSKRALQHPQAPSLVAGIDKRQGQVTEQFVDFRVPLVERLESFL